MGDYYRHPFNRFVMTAAVKAEADANGSHWFTDVVESHQHVLREEFQDWRLVVYPDKRATAIAAAIRC